LSGMQKPEGEGSGLKRWRFALTPLFGPVVTPP